MTEALSPRPRFLRAAAAALAAVLAVTYWWASGPAYAEDPVEIPLEEFSGTLIYDPDSFTVEVPPAESATQVPSQCFTTGGGTADPTQGCLGMATVGSTAPLTFNDVGSLFPFFKHPEAAGALGWMVSEGMEHLRVMYDIPRDYRMERWARGELRTHVVSRILGIMDKEVFGVPLTEQEQAALDFVEEWFLEQDRFMAQGAYDEYLTFKASPCTYQVPTPPKVVTKPTQVPERVTEWCKFHAGMLAESVSIAPPLPKPEEFIDWTSYRYADELGLTAFADPAVQKNMSQVAVGTATAVGFAVAAGAGASAFFFVASTPSLALQIGTKLHYFLSKPSAFSAVKAGSQIASRMATQFAGALASAFIAVVVIVAVVVIGVASYLVIEHESVAASLKATVAEANKATDPFVLDPLIAKSAGQPINSVAYVDLPPYRSSATYNKLSSAVTLWTTVPPPLAPEGPDDIWGDPVPDPGGIWPDYAPTASDPKWIVSVGDREPTTETSFSVPQLDKNDETVYVKVSRSKDWLVITEPGKPPRPALSFGYLDEAGVAQVAQRAPTAVGGFIITDGIGPTPSRQTDSITFRDDNDRLVKVKPRRTAPGLIEGPRPSAVGPLLTQRPVMLRPNPVGSTGASLDPGIVQADYEFSWDVKRLNTDTGEWEEAHSANGYGTSFVPTEVGEYFAEVTMTAIADPTDVKFGSVRFGVNPPPMNTLVWNFSDDGYDRLELDLQLQEPVASDELTVTVTWPGELGSESDPITTLVMECFQTGPLECTTQRTGPSDLLVRTLPDNTDLDRPVRVVVTNSAGGVVSDEFLLGPQRPSIAPAPEGANDDEPGSVFLDGGTVQVDMPLADEVQDYVVAKLIPSAGGGQEFGLVDPETGNTTANIELPGSDGLYASVFTDGSDTYLEVWGTPNIQNLGTYEAPVLVFQTNGTRSLVRVVVNVTPSTGDRFRGGLQSDIDPNDNAVVELPRMQPSVLGGRVGLPAYRGSMCLSLQLRDFGAPPEVQCRNVSDYVRADGRSVAFPFAQLFPGGMPAGSYEAAAWLKTPDDSVDTEPLYTRFFLTQAASYPRPTVELRGLNVQGQPRVGETLKAEVGTPFPRDADLSYQWLRDGDPIRGATGARYRVVRADIDDRLAVRVTATHPGWLKEVKTSPGTGRVAR